MAKSKKDKEDEFANEIEAENRKNEQDDPSSGEEGQGEEEDEDEDDEDAMLKKNAKREIVVKEEDYEENEKLNFSADVYNFTICANMTKCCIAAGGSCLDPAQVRASCGTKACRVCPDS